MLWNQRNTLNCPDRALEDVPQKVALGGSWKVRSSSASTKGEPEAGLGQDHKGTEKVRVIALGNFNSLVRFLKL